MKGAVATQIGIIQFVNFTVADCGGGPNALVTNGKDNGGSLEMTWIVDSRRRTRTLLTDMAGVQVML